MLDVLARSQLAGRSAPDDLALLEDVVRVRDARQRRHVLVDQQQRLAARLEPLDAAPDLGADQRGQSLRRLVQDEQARVDRKSTRLNSSHVAISYAVFCLKKKTAIEHGQTRLV